MSALDGVLALVTGSSRGIGAEVAAAFARSRREGGAGRAQPGAGAARRVRRRVLRSERAIGSGGVDRSVLTEFGTPDVIVSNAGVFDRIPFEQTTIEELQRQLAVNLVGPFALARGLLPSMRVRGTGLHISIGSVADHNGFPENSIYSATKYGLRGLHESLSAEYRGSGVRFTLVSPGPTDTTIWDTVSPEAQAGIRSRSSMLRAADVADAVLFVATRPPSVVIDWLRLGPA